MMRIVLLLLVALFECTLCIAQWSTDPRNNLIVGYGLLPELCSDSAGGCYITYEADNLGYPRHLNLERLNRYGYKPWGTYRRILGVEPEQSAATLTEDGEGGVLVGYRDLWTDQLSSYRERVRVQRVDSGGNFLWGSTGALVSLSETNQAEQAIVSDGTGGCIVAWLDSDTITYDFHLRINMINSSGVRVWGDSGKFLWDYGFQAPDKPPLVADGRGGCYIRFGVGLLQRFNELGSAYWATPILVPTNVRMMRVDILSNVCLFGGKYIGYQNGELLFTVNLQKVDTSGTLLWDSLGVVLDTINANNFPTTWELVHEDGYSTVCWPQRVGGLWDLRTQIVRFDGSTVFPFRGKAISRIPSNKGLVGAIPSDSSTSLFVWWDQRTNGGTYAQRLDTLGGARWDTNDVAIGIPGLSYLKATTDGSGGVILAGSGENFSIGAQQLNSRGNLGHVIASIKGNRDNDLPEQLVLQQNYPNPFNGATIIKFHIPLGSKVKMRLYNILGEEMRIIVDGYRDKGEHSAILIADDLPTGMYFYTLETSHSTLVRKLILLK